MEPKIIIMDQGLEVVVELVGVDPNRIRPENCQDCGVKLDEEAIDTCTHTHYITLCRVCYLKAGNSVR